MKKKSVLFVGFVNDYEKIDIFLLRDFYNVHCLLINKYIFKCVNKLIPIIKLKRFFLNSIYLYKLNRFKNIDLIIFKDESDYIDFIPIKTKQKKILILRNIVSDKIKKIIMSEPISIYTFDKGDSIKFGYHHYNQYSNVTKVISANIIDMKFKYDICFLGKNKNRKTIIDDIYQNLSSKYKVNFHVIDANEKNKFMSYRDYLKFQLYGKAVLDIVQSNQSSETMRFLEAMFTKRKVITNNKSVLVHELYNENNVLYFSSLDFLYKNIDEFMMKPFVVLDDETLSKYLSINVLNDLIALEL